jgi:hypothetical protein
MNTSLLSTGVSQVLFILVCAGEGDKAFRDSVSRQRLDSVGKPILRQCGFHRADRSLLHARKHVGVCVNRLRDVGVPEPLLHDLRIHVLGEQKRGAGVPEVVEAYKGEPGLLKEGPEGAVGEVSHVQGRAAGREDWRV